MAVANSSARITDWLRSVERGDSEAATQLWDQYFERLVEIARMQIGKRAQRIIDGEDVALSVLDTLVRGAAKGRFHDLQDRRELWYLLLSITANKVNSRKRRENAQKRGGGQVRESSSLGTKTASGAELSFDDFHSNALTPDFLVAIDDEHGHLMGMLPSDTFRRIAQELMEGYTVAEISRRLNISTRTVHRKIQLIRASWSEVLSPSAREAS